MPNKDHLSEQPSFLPGVEGQRPENARPEQAGKEVERVQVQSLGQGSPIEVLLPLPLRTPFTYILPDGMRAETGQFVRIPLAGRMVRGCVWRKLDQLQGCNDMPPKDGLSGVRPSLKPIDFIYETKPLAPEMIDFITWVSEYTLSPLGAVLRLVMRTGAELERPSAKRLWQRTTPLPADIPLSAQRNQLIERLPSTPNSLMGIARATGVSQSVVRGFAKAGGLVPVEVDPDTSFESPVLTTKGPDLSQSQADAVYALCHTLGRHSYSCQVLDGVTGAGKTEVYLETVATVLRENPDAQILVLLPEIALTLPFLERVARRFEAQPAPWHSDMSPTERRRVWRCVLNGRAQLVVGARSALFLPFQNLKLIIVDEEHEAAYKQAEGVMYHARDMAVARAARGKFGVILVSATPSLETLVNMEEGRYSHVQLNTRYGAARLPDVEILDLRKMPPRSGQWLAPRLVDEITQTIKKETQALLFLNRRGYAPLTICRKCGERLMAPDSDTWLVEHRHERRLMCHHTGFSMPIPDTCPHCGSADSLAACGPGVERIAEEAKIHWPAARVEIFSSDSTRSPTATQALLERMQAGEIDVLVATQVVAKGHHFPKLTCVGVVDADLGLSGGDLRAAERTYQLLSQVAGRAGRGTVEGKVFLQSWQPFSPVIQGLAVGDRDGFMRAEAQGRRDLCFPPFGRLASVLLTAENEQKLNKAALALAQHVPQADGIDVWGPAPAALYRLRGTYRVRFLVKTDRATSIQRYIKAWLSLLKLPSGVRHVVDIDPYQFG